MTKMIVAKIIDGVCWPCEQTEPTCYETTLEVDDKGNVWKRCGECGEIY